MRHHFDLILAIVTCLLLAFILPIWAFTSSDTPPHLTSQSNGIDSQPLPTNIKPFSKVDIRVHFEPDHHAVKNNQQYDPQGEHFAQQGIFSSLSDFTSDNLSTLSDTPASTPHDAAFIPFGHHVRLSFGIPRGGESQSNGSGSNDDEDNNNQIHDQEQDHLDNYLFILRIDDTAVSTDPNYSMKLEIDVTSQGNNSAEVKYSKRVTYTGEQINSDGTIDKAFITILSNSGDWDRLYRSSNNGLETQSDDVRPMKPESLSPLSGRHDNGYTIEGMILKADGKMIQIASYTSLLFQQYEVKMALEEQLNSIQELNTSSNSVGVDGEFDAQGEKRRIESLMSIQGKLSELNDFMSTLYQQQNDAAYDLSFSEVHVKNFQCGGGVSHDEDAQQDHSDNNTDQSDDSTSTSHSTNNDDIITTSLDNLFTPNVQPGSPLNMVSQWVLEKWTGCHLNQNKKATVFQVRFVLSSNFQKWASSLDWASVHPIDPSLVDARVQYVVMLMNYILSQQLEVSLSIQSTFYLPNVATLYNPQGRACDITVIFNEFRWWLVANSSTQLTAAFSHLLLHCFDLSPNDPNTTSGTAGIAYTDGLCRNHNPTTGYAPMGVTSFTTGYVTTWGYLLHEIGHHFNMQHAWNSAQANGAAQGTIGGLMDAGGDRLSSSVTPVDNRLQIGFNKGTDSVSSCALINTVLTNSDSVRLPLSQCLLDINMASSVTSMKLYTPNNVLDPYEQCEYNAAQPGCCNSNGRFTTQSATCGAPNECCNSSCQSLGADVACKVRSTDLVKMGYCSAGQCVPTCINNTPHETCATDTNFKAVTTLYNSCKSQCTVTCNGVSGTYTRDVISGSTCGGTPSSPHHCIGTAPHTAQLINQYTCTVPTTSSYTWRSYVVRECVGTTVTQIDSYLCMNPVGFVVGDNFCASSPRPAPIQSCAAHATFSTSITLRRGTQMDANWEYNGSNYYNKVDIVFVVGAIQTVVATNVDVFAGTYLATIPLTGPSGIAKWKVMRAGTSVYFAESATFAVNSG